MHGVSPAKLGPLSGPRCTPGGTVEGILTLRCRKLCNTRTASVARMSEAISGQTFPACRSAHAGYRERQKKPRRRERAYAIALRSLGVSFEARRLAKTGRLRPMID